jgi:hypothetical protein
MLPLGDDARGAYAIAVARSRPASIPSANAAREIAAKSSAFTRSLAPSVHQESQNSIVARRP